MHGATVKRNCSYCCTILEMLDVSGQWYFFQFIQHIFVCTWNKL